MLYGKNGTGKSRILDQLTKAFQGIGDPKDPRFPPTLLHTSVEVRPIKGDTEFVKSLYGMLDVPEELEHGDNDRIAFQDAVLRRLNSWGELAADHPSELLEYSALRTSAGFHLSIAPCGTPAHPAWSVYVSGILDADAHAKMAAYGTALSKIYQSIVENSDLGSEDWVSKIPFYMAQSREWYTEPFRAILDAPSKQERYVSIGSSPMANWPLHIPVPLVQIGTVSSGPAEIFVDSMTLSQIQRETLTHVSAYKEWNSSIVKASVESELDLSESVLAAVDLVETEANRILELLADFSFKLHFDVATPSDWFAGNPPKWVVIPRHSSSERIELERLSFSEQKWVRFALSMVLSNSGTGNPRITILDEPEQGLHRQLETRVSTGIQRLVSEYNDVTVVGATHSPAFLDVRHGSRLLHVSLIGSGKTIVSNLEVGVSSRNLDEEAERLGVSLSDILALTRVAVVVEGTHDQIVLEKLLARDIRQSGARIFMMRGTDNTVALPDMQFLFDALDAPIVVVLDNMIQSRVMPIWKKAVDAFRDRDVKQTERYLSELSAGRPTKEERALVELGMRAIRVGKLSRITPFGLEQSDILDYLSPLHFDLGANDWQGYKKEFNATPAPRGSFKEFLQKRHGAKINVTRVSQAAEASDDVPDDISTLGTLIRELGFLGAPDDVEIMARNRLSNPPRRRL